MIIVGRKIDRYSTGDLIILFNKHTAYTAYVAKSSLLNSFARIYLRTRY